MPALSSSFRAGAPGVRLLEKPTRGAPPPPWASRRSPALELALPAAAILGGFAILVWGADRFVDGAAVTAEKLGISRLVIGLTVVAFGTSAPEVIVSAMAALQGNGGLSIGNAIGSNVCNAGLVVGAAALVTPLKVQSKVLRREFPILFAAMLGAWALLGDGELGRLDGGLLLLGLAAYLGHLVRESLLAARREPDAIEAELAADPPDLSTPGALLSLSVGLVVLLAGSNALVWGASEAARVFGVSELVIGLSVIALGTSLPELAASVASALRDEPDLALGNVIGSNLFNLLAVLALPGLLSPGPVTPAVMSRDLPAMVGITVLVFVSAGLGRRRGTITRLAGLALVVAYLAYVGLLVVQRAL
ncbi:MAG TPA: calcium/sodium antiporter [Polyangiaceae bacterium LLY-WYZ-14_1]|nr:calcium/sodium antiporter [Polyangiaceae bacterium LLY-WYZ-14_1]